MAAAETRRRTTAAGTYRPGLPREPVRQKLGLSPVTWQYTAEKIERLASPAL